MKLTGIHHLTAVTANASGNHAFYTQSLGLRLVKKTVNQDDVSAYHLFYADGKASPGTDITFFDWPVEREKRGTHSIAQTALRVNGETALQWWKDRFGSLNVRSDEIVERDGRLSLDFEDFEGQRLSLVDDGGKGEFHPWERSPVPVEYQIRGLGPIRISVPKLERTARVLTEAMDMRAAREYRIGDTPVHVFEMGEGGPAAELHVAVEPGLSTGTSRRGRRASRRLPHAQRADLSGMLGEVAIPEGAVERPGGPLLLPEPVFPRAERYPVRDRHRRSGLCHRRTHGQARRAPCPAAVPGAAAGRDRSRPQAALGQAAYPS